MLFGVPLRGATTLGLVPLRVPFRVTAKVSFKGTLKGSFKWSLKRAVDFSVFKDDVLLCYKLYKTPRDVFFLNLGCKGTEEDIDFCTSA